MCLTPSAIYFALHPSVNPHGKAIGCVVDGVPARPAFERGPDSTCARDSRKPGQSKYTTQRKEPDQVEILSGTFEGLTTGQPISLIIHNTDQRSKDYGEIKDQFRPGHADFTYWAKYGLRDYRGGGRSSARETAVRVAAGAVAQQILAHFLPELTIHAGLVQMGPFVAKGRDWAEAANNPFFTPDAAAAQTFATELDQARKDGNSFGAAIEVCVTGDACGPGPTYLWQIRYRFGRGPHVHQCCEGRGNWRGHGRRRPQRHRKCRSNAPGGPWTAAIFGEPCRGCFGRYFFGSRFNCAFCC